jgi:molecular chaperone HscB
MLKMNVVVGKVLTFNIMSLSSFSANYFELFELPISFDIDKERLVSCYRDLQHIVHPDKYVNASEKERRLAMQKAVQINEAFQILKNPLSRGIYLLELQDVDSKDNQIAMDGEFLMAQMELREELASIKNIDSLNTFLSSIEKQIQNLTKQLSQEFQAKNWLAASNSVSKFQFFTKLHEEALRLEEKLI